MIGVLIETGVLPDSKVLRGSELSKRHRQVLVDLKLIRPDERIIYFYSAGLFSVAEDGNFFTPERVVSYENYEGEFSVSEATYSEILSIEVESEGGEFEDSILYIETTGEEDFYLLVSREDGKDKLFIQELRRIWQENREEAATAD